MYKDITEINHVFISLRECLGTHIVGQSETIDRLIIGLFAGGHILLEWVPWLAKTRMVQSLARSLALEFWRVSFTPDLLPSDLIGSEVYRPQTWEFYTRKWPIFTEILLADEINRTPPKVHAALLEAMQERKVTLWETTFSLPELFFVVATQNPIEQEGTYRLPEAELDRFMMKCLVQYPTLEEEQAIMKQETGWQMRAMTPLSLTSSDILTIRQYIREKVHIDENIYRYVNDLVRATRPWKQNPLSRYDFVEREYIESKVTTNLENIHTYIDCGASPRASLAFIESARIYALIMGRDYITPEDIQALAKDILRHRIILSYSAIGERITTDMILEKILENVIVP